MRRHGRKWKNALPLICFFCVALTLAMAIYTWFYQPDYYRAVYTFFALPAGTKEDENALDAARMLALDCSHLLQTEDVQARVLAGTESDGQTYVIARSMDGTHMIQTIAVGVAPDVTADLANAAGRELMRQAETALGAAMVREISPAEQPDAPFAPNRPLQVAATLVISFLALSLLGMLMGSSREPMRWGKPSANKLPAKCMGAVVRFDREQRREMKQASIGRCTLQHSVNRLVQEDIRRITLALRGSQEHAGYAVVTAAMMESRDCAAVTLLMAAELAAQGFDVLLIEMDAYELNLRTLLHTTGSHDVLDCMMDERALSLAILPTGIPRLCFIDSCHEPGALTSVMATQEFAQFVSDASHSFDYVFFNAPPAAALCDAAMLGAVTDMTLLMVEDGMFTAGEIAGCVNDLQSAVRRLGGCIFTRVPGRHAGRGGLEPSKHSTVSV